MSRASGLRSDDGAMAVASAFMAVLLLMVAALAVELTDVYSRDRAVQTRADLAALAGAQELPDPCAAAGAAHRNLVATANRVASSTPPPTSLSASSDNDPGDGEIQVLSELVPPPPPLGSGPVSPETSSGSWLSTATCGEGGAGASPGGSARYIRVITPPATREYAFARTFSLLDAGAPPGRATLQRSATAGISSPTGPGARVLPLVLPAGCGDGTQVAVTGPRPVVEDVTFDPPGAVGAPAVTILGSLATEPGSPFFDPAAVDGAIVVTVDLTGLPADPRSEPEGLVLLDFHTHDGTSTVRQPPAPAPGVPGTGVRDVGAQPGGTFQARVDATVPAGVESVPGAWRVRASQPNASGGPRDGWTRDEDAGVLTIEGEVGDGGACSGPVEGDFGLLDAGRCAPAAEAPARPCAPAPGDQLAVNLALGLDHRLTAFSSGALPPPTDPVPTRCSASTPPGALPDDAPSGVDGANCVGVRSGDVAAQATAGLVTGPGGGVPGRLARSAAMPVPATAPASCRNPAGGGDHLWRTPLPGGETVVNTVLSCYLAPGRTLGDVVAGEPGSLVAEVYQDPRFFFVPELNGLDRPPSGHERYAIRGFKGAFITDEGLTDGGVDRGAEDCAPGASGCNGVQFGDAPGGPQVSSVTALVFPPAALPEDVTQPGNGDPYISGTRDVVLME